MPDLIDGQVADTDTGDIVSNDDITPGDVNDTSNEQEAETEEDYLTEDNGDNTSKVKIGDKEYDISEIEEWQKGYLRQSDYTRKTQEIANQRKEIEGLMQNLQSGKGVMEFLKTNPEIANEFVEMVQKQNKMFQQLDDAGTPEAEAIKEIYTQQQKMMDLLNESNSQKEIAKLDAELQGYETKYPELKTAVGQKILYATLEKADSGKNLAEIVNEVRNELAEYESFVKPKLTKKAIARKNLPAGTPSTTPGTKIEQPISLEEHFKNIKRKINSGG